MAQRKTTPVSMEEAEEALGKIVLLKAELAKQMKLVRDACRQHGGFEHKGLYVFNQQTVNYTYMPDVVAEAIEKAGVEDPLQFVLNYLTDANMRRLVEKNEYSEVFLASMKDPASGSTRGQKRINGGASIDVRESAPGEGTHHIVEVGAKPLDKWEDPLLKFP